LPNASRTAGGCQEDSARAGGAGEGNLWAPARADRRDAAEALHSPEGVTCFRTYVPYYVPYYGEVPSVHGVLSGTESRNLYGVPGIPTSPLTILRKLF